MTAKLPEKRSDQRVDIVRPVFLANAIGVTRDISASGAFFWIRGNYAPGDSISFSIELQRLVGESTLKCRGDVVRTEPRNSDVGVAVRLTKTTMEAISAAGRGMDALDPRSSAADRPVPRPQPRVTDPTWDDAAVQEFYNRRLVPDAVAPDAAPAAEVDGPLPRRHSRVIVGTAVLAAIVVLGYYVYLQSSPVAAPKPAPVAAAEKTKPAPAPARTAASAIPVQKTSEPATVRAPEPAPVAAAERTKPAPAPAGVEGDKSSSEGGEGRPKACPGSHNAAIWTNCVGEVELLDGRKYVGEFRDGQYHGQGTETFPDGRNYVGEFRHGQYRGQGIATFPDGRKYVGEFRDGQYHGQGQPKITISGVPLARSPVSPERRLARLDTVRFQNPRRCRSGEILNQRPGSFSLC